MSDLRTTVEMKGFTDELNYIVELLEGGTTLEDVIDNHIYEQALVSGSIHYAVPGKELHRPAALYVGMH